jgi:hypothetical protein
MVFAKILDSWYRINKLCFLITEFIATSTDASIHPVSSNPRAKSTPCTIILLSYRYRYRSCEYSPLGISSPTSVSSPDSHELLDTS